MNLPSHPKSLLQSSSFQSSLFQQSLLLAVYLELAWRTNSLDHRCWRLLASQFGAQQVLYIALAAKLTRIIGRKLGTRRLTGLQTFRIH
jgi:hypothetical protein